MFQIRTIQKGNKNTAYGAVVDLRAKTKKNESLSAIPLRIQERQKTHPFVQQEEKSQNSFGGNSAGILPRTLASFLVGFFLLNPFLDVYADELPIIPLDETVVAPPPELAIATSSPDSIATTPPVAETESTISATTTLDNLPQEEATSTEPIPEIFTEVATSTPEADTSVTNETIAPGLPITETTALAPDLTNATTSEVVVTDTESVVSDIVVEASDTPAEESVAVTPSEDTTVSEQVKTDEVDPESPKVEVSHEPEKREEQLASSSPVQAVNVIEHKYLFRENECTRLDDGAFYCAPPETASSTNISNTQNTLPRVYVKDDTKSGGNKEIFFEDVNGKVRITNNNYDDDAPAYDKNSNLLVWHALIKGRMQIMSSGRSSNITRQLTDTSYNNTDPKIHGKSVVWQGWVNNNWEIFYIKDVTAEPLKIEQITTNEQPDMFPIISDSFITWQSFFGGSWRVFVYNLDNGQTSQISQPEAGKYENPRFALLFENRKENGEVETVGYDVVSGKEIPINAAHVPSPAAPTSGGEEDKAVPVPAGQTGTGTTTPMKNPGKDDEGEG